MRKKKLNRQKNSVRPIHVTRLNFSNQAIISVGNMASSQTLWQSDVGRHCLSTENSHAARARAGFI